MGSLQVILLELVTVTNWAGLKRMRVQLYLELLCLEELQVSNNLFNLKCYTYLLIRNWGI